MKYKKKENAALDAAFKSARSYGMLIRFHETALFYRKRLHWEYLLPEEAVRIHRRVEEVISHTSCCAENMDIQKFIVTMKSGEMTEIHICDGEPRLAEKLYDDVQTAWPDLAYGMAK